MKNWVSSELAAEILGVSRPTITKMIADGRLQPLGYVNDRIAVFDRSYLERVKPNLVINETGKRVGKETAVSA